MSFVQTIILPTSNAPPNMYPLVPNIEDIVPEPFTQEVPLPHGIKAPPSAMRMVQWLGGAAPSFDNNPHCFSIPGKSLGDAQAFVESMQATFRWSLQNFFDNIPTSPPVKKLGRPPEYHFKLYYTCPRRGHHLPRINSRKEESGRKCGCEAKFNIFHHIATDSLRVEWHWQHSHDLNTHEDMKHTRIPKAVHDWIVDRVDSGIGWKGIQNLLSSPDLEALTKTGVAIPEANGILYDKVRHLIKT
ncbi:hypothetical protein PGTUg99_008511 [Puccinia graminis f. sp. tritici]|uniref:FAR1 domain-containing protein n=1 Tax=Puccinia graminis f. sp. tritici TaxID=56615 RepID=A0A5B0QK82_PUCGR|nr:hypothetical protein PGTUg99_008511 [Puccinia graminis f. sp. tritici]